MYETEYNTQKNVLKSEENCMNAGLLVGFFQEDSEVNNQQIVDLENMDTSQRRRSSVTFNFFDESIVPISGANDMNAADSASFILTASIPEVQTQTIGWDAGHVRQGTRADNLNSCPAKVVQHDMLPLVGQSKIQKQTRKPLSPLPSLIVRMLSNTYVITNPKASKDLS